MIIETNKIKDKNDLINELMVLLSRSLHLDEKEQWNNKLSRGEVEKVFIKKNQIIIYLDKYDFNDFSIEIDIPKKGFNFNIDDILNFFNKYLNNKRPFTTRFLQSMLPFVNLHVKKKKDELITKCYFDITIDKNNISSWNNGIYTAFYEIPIKINVYIESNENSYRLFKICFKLDIHAPSSCDKTLEEIKKFESNFQEVLNSLSNEERVFIKDSDY